MECQKRKLKKRKIGDKIRERNKSDRMRVSVFISNRHVYAQLINDKEGRTICCVTSMEDSFKSIYKGSVNAKLCEEVGRLFSVRAAEKGVTTAVLDRGARIYGKRIAAFADAAREKLVM